MHCQLFIVVIINKQRVIFLLSHLTSGNELHQNLTPSITEGQRLSFRKTRCTGTVVVYRKPLLCLTGQTRADAAEQVAFHRTCLRYQCMDMTAQTVDTAGTTGEVHRIDLFRPHTEALG
jgi:hypothetical protein